MLPIALISWWYTTAWVAVVRRVQEQLRTTLNFFSVGLLMRTLFDPFRQIAAVKGRGSVDAQLRAWADRSFSRMVGAVVRGIFIVAGVTSAAFVAVLGVIQVLLWPCVPFMPLIAIMGMVAGWTL